MDLGRPHRVLLYSISPPPPPFFFFFFLEYFNPEGTRGGTRKRMQSWIKRLNSVREPINSVREFGFRRTQFQKHYLPTISMILIQDILLVFIFKNLLIESYF